MENYPDTYQIIGGQRPAIKCLMCSLISYHSQDVEMRYCAYCQVFHEDIWPPARQWCIEHSAHGNAEVAMLAQRISFLVAHSPQAKTISWRGRQIDLDQVWSDRSIPLLDLTRLREAMQKALNIGKPTPEPKE